MVTPLRRNFSVQRSVVDDVINGGAGNDVLWGQGGNDSLTGGSRADDAYFFKPGEGGIDEIIGFEAGNSFLVDVASLSLSALDATAIAAGDFASGTDTTAGFNGTGKEFFFETDTKTLWYSDNGTVANQIALATISSGRRSERDTYQHLLSNQGTKRTARLSAGRFASTTPTAQGTRCGAPFFSAARRGPRRRANTAQELDAARHSSYMRA